MAAKSKSSRQSLKPYPDYPLTAHTMGRWCKKIKGTLYYFGPLSDPEAALRKYLENKDRLQAGLGWPTTEMVVTVADLFEQYIDAQDKKVKSRELSPRTFADYHRICNNAAAILGKEKPAAGLTREDFSDLRTKLAETNNLTSLKPILQKIKSAFTWAFDNELLDKPY